MGNNPARTSPTQASILHQMLQNMSCAWSADFQEEMPPGWVPRVSTSPARKSAPEWDPVHGVSPARTLLQWGFPWGQTFLENTSTCCGFGSSMGCISVLPQTFIGCRGTASLTMDFITGCRNVSALVPTEVSSLSFLMDLPDCRVVSLTETGSSRHTDIAQLFFCLFHLWRHGFSLGQAKSAGS